MPGTTVLLFGVASTLLLDNKRVQFNMTIKEKIDLDNGDWNDSMNDILSNL